MKEEFKAERRSIRNTNRAQVNRSKINMGDKVLDTYGRKWTVKLVKGNSAICMRKNGDLAVLHLSHLTPSINKGETK